MTAEKDALNPCYTPSFARHSEQKWDAKYYNEHRHLVSVARPMVDTKPPKTYMHLHLKLKKLQLEEERLATIERDNRILLEKMSFIMRTRGRIDNRNDYEYKSLNREKRIRELIRITRENQEILKRICARQPEYDHRKWQRDWEENQAFMDNISAYPKDWWKTGQEGEPKSARESSARSKKSMKSSAKSRKESSAEQQQDEGQEQEEQQDEKEQEKESSRQDTPAV